MSFYTCEDPHWHNAFPNPNQTITTKCLTKCLTCNPNLNLNLTLTFKLPFEVVRSGQNVHTMQKCPHFAQGYPSMLLNLVLSAAILKYSPVKISDAQIKFYFRCSKHPSQIDRKLKCNIFVIWVNWLFKCIFYFCLKRKYCVRNWTNWVPICSCVLYMYVWGKCTEGPSVVIHY